MPEMGAHAPPVCRFRRLNPQARRVLQEAHKIEIKRMKPTSTNSANQDATKLAERQLLNYLLQFSPSAVGKLSETGERRIESYVANMVKRLHRAYVPVEKKRFDHLFLEVPAVHSYLQAISEQLDHLQKNIPAASIKLAIDWLQSDRATAILAIERDSQFVSELVYDHLMDLTLATMNSSVREKHVKAFERSMRQADNVAAWAAAPIASAGGPDYFLCLALASLVAEAMMVTGVSLANERGNLDTGNWVNSVLRRHISDAGEDLWLECMRGEVEFLGELDDKSIPSYVAHMNRLGRRQFDFLMGFLDVFGTYRDSTAIAEQEAAGLRRRLLKTEDQLAEKCERYAILQKKLENKERAAAAPLVHDKELALQLDAEFAQNRALNKKLEQATEELAELDAENKRLREFANVLLMPSGQAEERAHTAVNNQWKTSRVVIVGGHEKLHAKLRRELPNANFIHPDQINFAPGLFKDSAGVLFCANYCSHTLIWRAANEVRKHALPAGFSNHNNVDFVLSDLRNILLPDTASVN